MRAVVQRVDRAHVNVGERCISSINKGIIIYLGIEKGDSQKDVDYLLEKVVNLRIFEDLDGRMNLSVLDIAGEMLVVSQFTLLGDCRKGRRPSFVKAEEPHKAKNLYESFLGLAQEKMKRAAGGEFQAMMKVETVNDGPVTMLLDSRKVF
jgi:D-aminoacyl-tRNA deacylase